MALRIYRSWIIAAGLVASGVLPAAESSVTVIPGASTERLSMAWTDGVRMPVMFREAHINTSLLNGKNFNGELIVLHDAGSGRFWWWLGNENYQPNLKLDGADWFAAHAAVFENEDGIVVFRVSAPSLFISSEKGLIARAPEEAQQKAIDEITSARAELERNEFDGRSTTLRLPLPLDFFQPPMTSSPMPDRVKIASVAREGKGWKLLLRGEWDQEVILDEEFKLVSTTRVESPK